MLIGLLTNLQWHEVFEEHLELSVAYLSVLSLTIGLKSFDVNKREFAFFTCITAWPCESDNAFFKGASVAFWLCSQRHSCKHLRLPRKNFDCLMGRWRQHLTLSWSLIKSHVNLEWLIKAGSNFTICYSPEFICINLRPFLLLLPNRIQWISICLKWKRFRLKRWRNIQVS